MKLNQHQRHYNQYFKKLRKEFNTKISNVHYMPYNKFGNDKLTKVLKEFQKYKHANIFRVDVKQSEHALNTSSTIPETFDMEIYIYNTPTVLMFEDSKLYGIVTHSSKEQYFPYMYGVEDIPLHPYSTSIMNDEQYVRFIMNSPESAKLIPVLQEYILDHKQYSEEEIAQLEFVLPDPHIFIAVNELRLHIDKNLTKNSTVHEMINICTVLNYTNTENNK